MIELRAQSEALIKQGQNFTIPKIENTTTSTNDNSKDINPYF